jgi:hypothetical protein
MKVEDVAPNGYSLARATVRQRKTGRPVRFELTEQTRQAVDNYLKATGKVPGEFLFTSRRRVGEARTTRQYARLPSLSKSKSAVSGQSGHCSARLLAALRAIRRPEQVQQRA